MTYLLDPFEEDLVALAAEVVRKEGALSVESPAASHRPELWQRLAGDLGWVGVVVPEEYGGAGASFAHLCLIVQECGRELVGVPLADSAVASLVLAELAPDELRARLLPGLAAGEVAAALAFGPDVEAQGDHVRGTVRYVLGAPGADLLLVLAADSDGAVLSAVKGDEVEVRTAKLADHTRLIGHVTFDGPGYVVARGTDAVTAWDRARARRAAALAAESAGAAARCVELATNYALQRRQFGRLIGSYQAVKHLLANAMIAAEQAKVAARRAATRPPDHRDFVTDSAVAKLFSCAAAQRAAEGCFQIHGGIAFTAEHPVHLYFRRAQVNNGVVWDGAACIAQVEADLLG